MLDIKILNMLQNYYSVAKARVTNSIVWACSVVEYWQQFCASPKRPSYTIASVRKMQLEN